FIFALIPVRALLMPRFFTAHELGLLDAPTASPFTMESAGGSYGAATAADGASDDGANASSGILGCGTEAGKSEERLAEEGRKGVLENEESDGLNRRRPGAGGGEK
ncbi:hypothetical protein EKO27_g1796, partial [Xylaria grammica]